MAMRARSYNEIADIDRWLFRRYKGGKYMSAPLWIKKMVHIVCRWRNNIGIKDIPSILDADFEEICNEKKYFYQK